MLFDWIERDDVQLPFSVFQSLLDRFDQARFVGFVDCGAILDCENEPRQALDLQAHRRYGSLPDSARPAKSLAGSRKRKNPRA